MDSFVLKRIQELTKDCHIREGRPTAQDAISFKELFNATYNRQVTADYYMWQFFHSSFLGKCLFVEHGDRIVATYGLRAFKFYASGECLIGACVDLIIAPEFQRTGILARLAMEMDKLAVGRGCVSIYTAPNLAVWRPYVLHLGWSDLGEINTCIALTDTYQRQLEYLTFFKVDKFALGIDEVYQSFQKTHPELAMVVRNSAYLNWRFVDNPWYNYSLFVAKKGNSPFGYLILKNFQDPQSGEIVGDIVDLLWSEDDPGALSEMLNFALREFHAQAITRANVWLKTNTILDRIGQNLGFSNIAHKRYFCAKVFMQEYKWLETPNRWFITMADSEVY